MDYNSFSKDKEHNSSLGMAGVILGMLWFKDIGLEADKILISSLVVVVLYGLYRVVVMYMMRDKSADEIKSILGGEMNMSGVVENSDKG